MRASRLVSILLLLETQTTMTAQELAQRLDVSERTIYRDVEALTTAGIPLYGVAGRDGGYRLVDGYRTRLNGLTRDEAEALFLTGLPSVADHLGLADVVSAAQLKLVAALPKELRTQASLMRERFHLDPPPWYQGGDHTPHLATVLDAVWHQRVVRLRYRRWETPRKVSRTVEPYGVVLKAGQWYLVARTAGDFRTYRVARIMDVCVVGERFDRDQSFELAAHWRAYLEDFDTRRRTGWAVVRMSPDGMNRFAHLGDPALVRAARESAVPDANGWIRVTIPRESPDQAVRDLLHLGPDVEIVAPEGLRVRMVETLAEMAGRYAPTERR